MNGKRTWPPWRVPRQRQAEATRNDRKDIGFVGEEDRRLAVVGNAPRQAGKIIDAAAGPLEGELIAKAAKPEALIVAEVDEAGLVLKDRDLPRRDRGARACRVDPPIVIAEDRIDAEWSAEITERTCPIIVRDVRRPSVAKALHEVAEQHEHVWLGGRWRRLQSLRRACPASTDRMRGCRK